jgi:tripartite-type tricarboxylate transporter receptor subunit TctC
MKRREFLSLVGGAMAAFPRGASAQALNWPQRVVRIIVPYVPGGGTDAVARILATGLSKSAGYQIVIENKGGGSTNIGTEAVAHAAPDGYTVLFCSLSFAINRFLFTTLGYDSFTDFAPVTLLATYPDLMAVPNTSPAKSVAEFIAYAKANGGKTTFSSSGTGSSPHLAGELFKRRAGIEMTHIPYRGAGPGLTDVIAGRVDVVFNTFGATLGLVRDGLLRGLAVTSAKRFAAAPDLPTVAETALPGFDVTAWYVSMSRRIRPRKSCASSTPTRSPCSQSRASATKWNSSASRWLAPALRSSPATSRPRPSCGGRSSRPRTSGASDDAGARSLHRQAVT